MATQRDFLPMSLKASQKIKLQECLKSKALEGLAFRQFKSGPLLNVATLP